MAGGGGGGGGVATQDEGAALGGLLAGQQGELLRVVELQGLHEGLQSPRPLTP